MKRMCGLFYFYSITSLEVCSAIRARRTEEAEYRLIWLVGRVETDKSNEHQPDSDRYQLTVVTS
jgi:hypothetical protein